jgi:hypothetical protein
VALGPDAIPEPGSSTLLGLVGALMIFIRRRSR